MLIPAMMNQSLLARMKITYQLFNQTQAMTTATDNNQVKGPQEKTPLSALDWSWGAQCSSTLT
jgi:hypothetical protein